MRLISWNCAQAAHRKLRSVVALQPDVLILAESARPDIVLRKAPDIRPSGYDWVGDNEQKGLSVFTFGSYSVARAPTWRRELRYFLPVRVTGPENADILATWAFVNTTPPKVIPNSPLLGEAVQYYASFLESRGAVMAGDFNAGVRWDSDARPEFMLLAKALASMGLSSAIHTMGSLPFGHRDEPATFFDRTKKDTPFHIDYVFSRRPATAARVGRRDEWRGLSDHMPLIVDLAVDAPAS